jgi:hypothetical protein
VTVSPTFHPLRLDVSDRIGAILGDALGFPADVDVECLELFVVHGGRVIALDSPDRTMSSDYRICTLVESYNMLRYQHGELGHRPSPPSNLKDAIGRAS